jgi:hypothetical protein
VDIEGARPAWNGYFDFFSLAVATIVLGGVLRVALKHTQDEASRTLKGA